MSNEYLNHTIPKVNIRDYRFGFGKYVSFSKLTPRAYITGVQNTNIQTNKKPNSVYIINTIKNNPTK